MYKAAISAFPKCYSLLFSLIIYSSTVGQVTHMHCKPTIVKKAEPLFFRLSANTVDPGGGGGGKGGTWVQFCWVCAAGFSEPLPHYSLFCGQL